MDTEANPDRPDRGFVLISVIWIAGLLAVIATAFAINIRVQILSAANTIQSSKAEFVADGLADLTAWKLAMAEDATKLFPRNGKEWACRWSDQAVARVSVQDQGGLIDLNVASADLLTRIFESAGLDDGDARKLAAAVEDYRDSDTDAVDGGSEPETYPGLTFGPKNAPFQAIEEIDQLPGMNDAVYNAVSPVLTVYSLQPGFDPLLMPARLRELLGIRGEGQIPSEFAPFTAPSHGTIYGIEVIARLNNGTEFSRKSIVAITRQPERPFSIMAWQRGGTRDTAQTEVLAGTACFN